MVDVVGRIDGWWNGLREKMTTASDEREIFISRVLVLNLSGKKAVPGTAQDIFALDTAFILIEGHPQC